MIKYQTVLLLAAGLSASLAAGTVGYNFTGTVTGFQGPAEPGFGGLAVGGTVFGSFVYDTATPNLGDSTLGAYMVQSMFLQVGVFGDTVAAPQIQIFLGSEYDWDIGGQGPGALYGLQLNLDDTIAPLVQTDTLLRPPPDPSTVDIRSGVLLFYHSPESNITTMSFHIDSVTACGSGVGVADLQPCAQPSGVPEPAPLATGAIGLIGLAAWKGYRRSLCLIASKRGSPSSTRM